jgi:hypothetical protein
MRTRRPPANPQPPPHDVVSAPPPVLSCACTSEHLSINHRALTGTKYILRTLRLLRILPVPETATITSRAKITSRPSSSSENQALHKCHAGLPHMAMCPLVTLMQHRSDGPLSVRARSWKDRNPPISLWRPGFHLLHLTTVNAPNPHRCQDNSTQTLSKWKGACRGQVCPQGCQVTYVACFNRVCWR